MWRPFDLRMPERSGDVVLERLNYYDANEDIGPAPLWNILRAVFDYPMPKLMEDVTFVSVVIESNSELSYRAQTKKPIYHPTLKDYRLCPNFPELCVDIKGNVTSVIQPKIVTDRWSSSVPHVYFGQLGSYHLTRIPGRAVPQFVSLVQIYGDAWSIDGSPRVEEYIYTPRNLEPIDLRPENIRLTYRGRNRSNDIHVRQDYQDFPLSMGLASIVPCGPLETLWRNGISPEIAYRNEYDCFYDPSRRAVMVQRGSVNCDWYANTYWAMVYIDWTTGYAKCFTTMSEACRHLKISRHELRVSLRHNRTTDLYSLLLV